MHHDLRSTFTVLFVAVMIANALLVSLLLSAIDLAQTTPAIQQLICGVKHGT